MAGKAVTVFVIASIFGVVSSTVFLVSKAKGAPEESKKTLLTTDDILTSQTMGELEIYYIYMGQLYFTGQIDKETYEALYQAYVTRFYDLIGANP